MSVVWDELAPPRPPDAGIKRDRWGRYLLPHPTTGKEQSWTRATTLANTLADRYGLEQWAKRNVVLGIGARSDLYAQAASCTVDDKKTLEAIVAQAEEAASAKAKANLGTALHRFTERVDAGEHIDIPDPWRADVQAYTATMTAAGLTVLPGWIERVLLIPDIDCAGTADRLLDAQPLPKVGDLKTGADVVRYGMTEIALQLAIYAHATHWYDPTTGELHPMPEVNRDLAVVMHLPVGKHTCTLYDVDITAGWEAVQLAVDVRAWRKRKNLAVQISSVAPAVPAEEPRSSDVTTPPCVASEDRTNWLRNRALALKNAGHLQDVADDWPADVPKLRDGGLTDDQIDQVALVLDKVETAHGIPFGQSDPLFAGFATADIPPTPATPAPAPPVENEAVEWTRQAREILDQFDVVEATAVRDLLFNEPTRTTRTHVEWIRAVAGELADPNGAVIFTYGPNGPEIVSTDAGDRIKRACRTKTEAVNRAKRLAKVLGRPNPRTFDQICTDPALSALVAAGHGAVQQPSNDDKELT